MVWFVDLASLSLKHTHICQEHGRVLPNSVMDQCWMLDAAGWPSFENLAQQHPHYSSNSQTSIYWLLTSISRRVWVCHSLCAFVSCIKHTSGRRANGLTESGHRIELLLLNNRSLAAGADRKSVTSPVPAQWSPRGVNQGQRRRLALKPGKFMAGFVLFRWNELVLMWGTIH